MPETFGSGTASSAFDPRALPLEMASTVIAAGGSGLQTFPDRRQYPVIVALDVVSFGGGSGGALYFWNGASGRWFVVFNIGSSSDAFSWRGFLALGEGQFGWQNSSDTQCSFTATGLIFPALE